MDYDCVANAIALFEFIWGDKIDKLRNVPTETIIAGLKIVVDEAGKLFQNHPFFIQHPTDNILKELDHPKLRQWLIESFEKQIIYLVFGIYSHDPVLVGMAANANKQEVEELIYKFSPDNITNVTIFQIEDSILDTMNKIAWWCCEHGLVKTEADYFVSRVVATLLKEGLIQGNPTHVNTSEYKRFIREFAFKGVKYHDNF